MGRRGAHPGDDPHCVIRVRRLPIDSGGYDSGGAYWGGASRSAGVMWIARGVDVAGDAREEITDFRRARSKAEALAAWRAEWPNARVY
jgi:hypothetical protein